MRTCKYIENPTWKTVKQGVNKEFIIDEYTMTKTHSKFFTFITSNNYYKCQKDLRNDCVIRFHEVYGKFDFVAKVYFDENNESTLKENFINKLLKSGAISAKKNLEFRRIKSQHIFQDNDFEPDTYNDCKELNYDKLHIISAFIELKKHDETCITPSELLDNIPPKLGDNELASDLIYKAYITDQNSILLYLNIDCRHIRKLNSFTTALDGIVDKEKYVKTTYISTKDQVNNKVIRKIFKPNQSSNGLGRNKGL